MNHIKVLALAASLCTTTVAFGQNLILNGSFEADGQVGTAVGVSPNSSVISNWTLQASSSATAFVVFAAPGGNEPNPADGFYILNIGGFGTTKGVGLLWQDFTTTPGTTYDVSFFFGRGNNDPTASENVSVQVSAFDIVSGSPSGGALNFIDSGNAPATGAIGNLTQVGFQFTAVGNTSRLLLDDTTVSSGQSLELDAVSVVAGIAPVPEPSSALLAFGSGAMLLLPRRRASV